MPPTGFDPLDPVFVGDPHAVYRRLRREDPVHVARLASRDVWVLTRYADVARCLYDSSARMQPTGADVPPELGEGPAAVVYRNLMVLNDPPKHGRIRRLAGQALTPRAVEGLRERVVRVVDEALDAAAERGEMEAVSELAFLVPLRVICGMLGIPEEDRLRLLEWTPDFFRIFLPAANDAEGIAACHRACGRFIDYLTEKIEERRRRPTDDVFSALVAVEEAGDRLSRDELVATVLSLLTGGFDTTMGLIGGAVLAFAEQPEELARLRREPALVDSAVEEILRWESPVQATYRHLPAPLELGRRTIPAEAPIWLIVASANRDEAIFADADRVDVGREPNEHLAFGGGRHFCIGAHLARLEGAVTIRRLVERFAEIERVEGGPPMRRPSFHFRAVERMAVRVRPAPR